VQEGAILYLRNKNDERFTEMKRYKLENKDKFLDRMVTPVFIAALVMVFHATLWVWAWIPAAIVWAYVIRNYKVGRWTI
jgi:hypothetical protein